MLIIVVSAVASQLIAFFVIANFVILCNKGNCGKIASTYYKIRELDLSVFLEKISKLLHDYIRRVEGIESLVYMHCVGIQLEKHFSKIRSHSLAGKCQFVMKHCRFYLLITKYCSFVCLCNQ